MTDLFWLFHDHITMIMSPNREWWNILALKVVIKTNTEYFLGTGIVLRTLYVLTHLISFRPVGVYFYYPQFTREET